MPEKRRVIVVGGGAAGFFAAITCAEQLGAAGSVTLYEATAHPLAKVRISGGGRELRGAFHRWQPRDTVEWFAARGVETKTEADGRMFPVTDDSATIVDCLLRAAEQAGVQLVTSVGVRKVERLDRAGGAPDFWVTFTDGSTARCDRLLLATGGNKSSAGLEIARALGHAIEPPVPSLFTFHIDDARLIGLSGVSIADVAVSVPGTKLREGGPLLITHWGLSGPAILKLSAWGARELAACNYECKLLVNFVPGQNGESLARKFAAARAAHPKRQLVNGNPLGLPARFWERMLATAKIAPTTQWAGVPAASLAALAARLTGAEFAVVGKSLNKEEFVTCGGVRLSEVEFKTMESKLCPGLYFAGEVLDIDGVTGGFNFQSAWTTGWLAGQAMGQPAP